MHYTIYRYMLLLVVVAFVLLRKLWSLLDHLIENSSCGVCSLNRTEVGPLCFLSRSRQSNWGSFITRERFVAWLPLAQSSFKDCAANIWASSSLMSGSGKLISDVLVLENISNIPATCVKGFCFQTTFFVKANIPLLALTDTHHH